MKDLILRLNDEKRAIKENGITVDGRLYKITFTGN